MPPRAARRTGVLAEWNDERGFGFVEAGGRRTFVHISAFDTAGGRPQSGDFVQFEVGTASDGRPCAVRASRVYGRSAHGTHRPARRGAIDAVTFVPVVAVVGYLALAVALLGASVWYPLAYLVLSGVAYLLYAADKRAAVAGDWRTPERTLLLVSLLGGWPGAVVAQQVLRHKNRKTSFQVAFWIAALLNVVVLLGSLVVSGCSLPEGAGGIARWMPARGVVRPTPGIQCADPPAAYAGDAWRRVSRTAVTTYSGWSRCSQPNRSTW